MSLIEKMQKSFALADEPGYVTYKGFAIDPNDDAMFVSEEEVDKYRKEALARARAAE